MNLIILDAMVWNWEAIGGFALIIVTVVVVYYQVSKGRNHVLTDRQEEQREDILLKLQENALGLKVLDSALELMGLHTDAKFLAIRKEIVDKNLEIEKGFDKEYVHLNKSLEEIQGKINDLSGLITDYRKEIIHRR